MLTHPLTRRQAINRLGFAVGGSLLGIAGCTPDEQNQGGEALQTVSKILLLLPIPDPRIKVLGLVCGLVGGILQYAAVTGNSKTMTCTKGEKQLDPRQVQGVGAGAPVQLTNAGSEDLTDKVSINSSGGFTLAGIQNLCNLEFRCPRAITIIKPDSEVLNTVATLNSLGYLAPFQQLGNGYSKIAYGNFPQWQTLRYAVLAQARYWQQILDLSGFETRLS